MTSVPPADQNARERQARYARRDASPIPLTRQEQAERRHHSIVGLWRHVFLWGPIVITLAVQLAFGGAWVGLIVVLLMRAVAMLAGGLLMLLAENLFSGGHRAWMGVNTTVSLIAGAMAVALTYQGVVSSGAAPLSEVWIAAAGGGTLALWPGLYNTLRSRLPTDYERMVWAARRSSPSRIVE